MSLGSKGRKCPWDQNGNENGDTVTKDSSKTVQRDQ